MYLHQSNRLEILLQQLRAILQEPLADPIMPEIIVVQHQGMAQWLTQQLAFAEGIAAHYLFPLPARFTWDMVRRLTGALPEEDLFRAPVLRWRIAGLLSSLLDRPAFQELAAYLRDDDDGAKHYQLAGRISDVFDQYQVYRPDLLGSWQQGRDDHWQAVLWRALTKDTVPVRARQSETFRRHLAGAAPDTLPPRCHLFGLNSLAPVYLDIVAQLDLLVEIHLYHLSPCRHYWSDLISARQQAALRTSREQTHPQEAFFDQGHPLLVSLGKVGQDFFRQLLDGEVQEAELYSESPQHHLLATLQNDILDLCDRTAGSDNRFTLAADDRSVQFHCCFSPLREVQVLHDRLLDLFQHMPELTPGDILVCAPDIQHYADAVAGVFGEAGLERRIPWSLADQSPAREHGLVRCFLDLLSLLDGRFSAPEVLALCETPALLRRFGLDPVLLPRLHTWARETGIRWGADEAHRRELKVAATPLHSWQFGQDRLLLGYLMGDCREPQAGLLPYGNLAGGEADDLGGFLALIDTLVGWRTRIHRSRNASDWSAELLRLIADCFASEQEEEGLALLREAITALSSDCRLAAYEQPISPAVLKAHLIATLGQTGGSQAFASGRVTFCNMVPMRSVPFRVLCLLGMNDQDFPRSQHPLSFDLMAAKPRLGDRNRRQDDRYLFLEALLSARDVFYLSWVGRSLRDDAILPPSVVVSELRDYLDQGCVMGDIQVSAHLTTHHPMQPFSHRCFNGSAATASYNPAWLPVAQVGEPPPFLTAPLPPPDESWRTLELRQLVRFWRHPVRFFLEERLGLRLRDDEAVLAESEPFALDGLDQYQLRLETVTALLDGTGIERLGLNCQASGLLPQGGFGQVHFDQAVQEGRPVADRLSPLLANAVPPLEIDWAIDSFRLTGWLGDLFPDGRIAWRAGRLNGALLMETWVQHLILNLLAPPTVSRNTLLVFRDGTKKPVRQVVLKPVTAPQTFLAQLLALYWEGLMHPLPFFPATSLAWAEAVRKGKDGLQAAKETWENGFNRDGEGQNPAYRLVYPQAHFNPSSEYIALADLFTPILEHIEDNHAAA